MQPINRPEFQKKSYFGLCVDKSDI